MGTCSRVNMKQLWCLVPPGSKPLPEPMLTWPCFYQTRSAWSADQGSNKNHSPVYNFAPTVTKFCVMWEGQALPHHTKFGNCRYKIVDSRAFLSWSLIHGLRWSGLIKAEPGSMSPYDVTRPRWVSCKQAKIALWAPKKTSCPKCLQGTPWDHTSPLSWHIRRPTVFTSTNV